MEQIFKHDLPLRVWKALNSILMTLPFALCWYLYYNTASDAPFFRVGNWVIILLYLLIYTYFGRIYEAFYVSFNPVSEMIYSQLLSAVLTNTIFYVLIIILAKYPANPLPLLACFAGQVAVSVTWSALSRTWYFRSFEPKKTLVVYGMREGLEELFEKYGMENKFHVFKTLSVEECLENLDQLDEMETVFLSGVHSADRNVIMKQCILKNIDVYVIPRVGDVILSSAKPMHLFYLPVLRVNRYQPVPEYLFLKRFFDIVCSGLALIVLSPIMVITAICIRRDGGPAFYKQCRLTKDGREFMVMKFRSMRVDAEKDGVARLSTGDNDDRITPVGRFIRKVRIDELPQLFNILKGEMSIVGPRPERPEIAAQYEEEMPEFRLRLQAKAGLTGTAQVYGKYNTTPYDKLQMDLMYIANPSILEDLRIIFATIKILFIPESTEGIEEGKETAQ